MRILLILMTLFVTGTFSVQAEPFIANKVENIDLNLREDEAAVSFLGLANGEAILLQGPNDKNILVNAGGKGTKAELEAWLGLYGVNKIEALILTNNGQEGTLNNLNQLIAKYNIQEIITTSDISKQLAGRLEQAKRISIVSWETGAKKEILPQMTAEVQFSGNEQDEGMDLTLQFLKHTIFLMSSFSKQAEQIILKKNLKDVNIFKLPNHHKEDTLSGKLIELLNPQIAILFAEEKQKLDRDILDDLHNTWSEIHVTKKHSAITIKFTKTNYEVITIPTVPEK
ncbi:ComEC/Rec2 family competence protein [Neobacillus vireti]|uniref:Hydrolase n=1 Tax=Neobacillus vireti LMG 21834 TaxID=1131730 RepID=A0AB94IHX1_9BACI|nr:hydrolase [Neobacillus vireti]ETI66627.1 hydrolase [Neobacillus vireti LMG 21834]KLT17193.1 hypothetical protein AA980_15005 [Neobacillus vireti]